MSQSGSGGSVFNIGSQQAGAIYQAGGDQIIHHGEGNLEIGVVNAMSDVRAALAAAAPKLSPQDHKQAADALHEADDELHADQPDKGRMGRGLARVASILKQVGALADSADALHRLAAWLGPAGAALAHVLL